MCYTRATLVGCMDLKQVQARKSQLAPCWGDTGESPEAEMDTGGKSCLGEIDGGSSEAQGSLSQQAMLRSFSHLCFQGGRGT